MMAGNSFFDTNEKLLNLYDIALGWVGTPFHAFSRLKGAGVDCVNLAAEIYKESGALTDFAPEKYSMDGGRHNKKSQVVDWVEKSGRFELVAAPYCGDLLCFQWRGRVIHHVGVALSPVKFVHAMAGRRVEIALLQDRTYSTCLRAIYRPIL